MYRIDNTMYMHYYYIVGLACRTDSVCTALNIYIYCVCVCVCVCVYTLKITILLMAFHFNTPWPGHASQIIIGRVSLSIMMWILH